MALPALRFGSLAAKQISEVLGSLRGASISAGPAADQTELHMTAILNPLTREAQRMSQVRLVKFNDGCCDRPVELDLSDHLAFDTAFDSGCIYLLACSIALFV